MDSFQVNTPYEIKQATMDDVLVCSALFWDAAQENNYLFPDPDDGMILNWVVHLIENKSLLVVVNNSIAVGVFSLEIKTFPWSTKGYLSNEVMYIRPEFRSQNLDKRLLSLAEEYAKINKLPLIYQYFTTEDTDLKRKLFKRRGYTDLGFVMVKT